ncbi:nucleolin 1 [Cornus florida]|uniref:nucleolin 1 n=1 Tax=Cornus florida TaxID=4283 RepID=UPI0028A04CAD|nr:nucleolin 1 [Cornus florida]
MDGADRDDDRTFKVNFSSDGAARLRDCVKEKLKEFMGDYTDDTLVEYVIVLLKNGRRKEEARNELNVFLGDDNYSFVSWLWDHLGSNVHLYVQPSKSYPDEAAKTKLMSVEQAGRNDSQPLVSNSEVGKSNKILSNRRNREWKGLIRDSDEPPPLRSSVNDNARAEERTYHKVGRAKRSLSPQPMVQKKRSRPDEGQAAKREAVSQATINAPRRLLQFAVRDAVGTSRPSKSTTEPALKRLRSVVSTTTGDSSLEDRPQRIRSVARVSNGMATAIKAVAEAAKGVGKVRSSVNVFDRLGRGTDKPQGSNQLKEFREAAVKDVEGDFDRIPEETHSDYLQGIDYRGQYVGKMTMLESDTGMASDSASDNEGYDDINVMGRSLKDVSQTGTSGGNKGDDSLMVQYSSVAENADEISRKLRRDQDQPASVANTSRKIVNISVNVNTWKPSHFQEQRETSEVDSRKSVQESEEGDAGKSGVRLMKENSNPVMVDNGNAKPAVVTGTESQRTLPSATGYSAGRPTEDADSRTIFVNNVHFAATKDSLSRHFNKFGEVLKVVIVTDAATGQPKGSAYVEFMRKDAAEHALSLDGTSFMSRILKVTRKSSAHQEAAPIIAWPRIARGSPFAAPRFPRVPFPRGMPNVYRPNLSIKPGARSMQWKRDAQPTPPASGTPTSSNVTPRSLTYVRTETKTNVNSETA